MTIDPFFKRVYNKENYNCAHFVSEVWVYLTGENVEDKFQCFLKPVVDRKASFSIRKQFKKLEVPESPSVVLLQRSKCEPHVGIFLNGKILHINETGVQYQPVNVISRCFDKINYYK